MKRLAKEKLDQAVGLVRETGLDAWLLFVRETAEGGDPALPLVLEGGLTWQSALLVTGSGSCVAIVGNYDADPLEKSGDWDEVVPYIQSIREPLVETLDRHLERANPRIGVNFSRDDPKADGLGHGMYLVLQDYLRGTRFGESLVSAEQLVMALRGRKTAAEVEHLRGAIRSTETLFEEAARFAKLGVSEREVYEYVQAVIDERGFGYGWDRTGNPIVNSGPDSAVGHGVPSPTIRISPGHVFHIDLGVVCHGYSSDIQRCWYVPDEGEKEAPPDVLGALGAVNAAISAGADALRPGVEGWRVDEAARRTLVEAGYSEYLHALGHQVGRSAHDGGTILGPRWERYGKTPTMRVHEDEVYTLELGVEVPGRGYLGLEEMVRVTRAGCEWMTKRQMEMPLLG
jgi:Xaa-Pro dipeptidase